MATDACERMTTEAEQGDLFGELSGFEQGILTSALLRKQDRELTELVG